MKKRNAQYEFIRTAAMLYVIIVHSLGQIPHDTPGETFLFRVLTNCFLVCNGLFFMLSGKFALAGRFESWEDYKRYYRKRVVGLLVPVLIYMLLRTVWDLGWPFSAGKLAKTFLYNVTDNFINGEYWFLYYLTGMLLMAPFLAAFFQKAGKRELLLFLLLGWSYNILITYVPSLGWTFQWKYPLADWFLFFPLGFALEKIVTEPKQERIVYILGILSLIVTVIQKYIGWAPGYANLAPTYACTVCAAFLGLKRLYRSGPGLDRTVLWVGKHSMGAYMLHRVVLYALADRIALPRYLPQAAVLIVLTTAVSLGGAFVIDNGLVKPVQKLLERKQVVSP